MISLFQNVNPMDYLELVKSLGGWGAVLIICWWMMRRMDRMVGSLEKAVAQFQEFEREERIVHTQIIEKLNTIQQTQIGAVSQPQVPRE